MARALGIPPTKPSHKRQKQSLKKANAFGYAKRQSRKAKNHASVDDVYEYEPGKSRRSNVRLELDKDESKEFGIASDGEIGDNVDREALRARLIGEAEEDDVIASGDDEEIDSDGAFEESDEERFGEFFTRKVRAFADRIGHYTDTHYRKEKERKNCKGERPSTLQTWI